jgi:hypothetical protein
MPPAGRGALRAPPCTPLRPLRGVHTPKVRAGWKPARTFGLYEPGGRFLVAPWGIIQVKGLSRQHAGTAL